ncbi:hypothetical protein B0H34DRAFT_427832 [Crassisporium funariophilum]|nr:hypothetical protein B0H34DRAFT_427832 [Crassisporium funariophilum]
MTSQMPCDGWSNGPKTRLLASTPSRCRRQTFCECAHTPACQVNLVPMKLEAWLSGKETSSSTPRNPRFYCGYRCLDCLSLVLIRWPDTLKWSHSFLPSPWFQSLDLHKGRHCLRVHVTIFFVSVPRKRLKEHYPVLRDRGEKSSVDLLLSTDLAH